MARGFVNLISTIAHFELLISLGAAIISSAKFVVENLTSFIKLEPATSLQNEEIRRAVKASLGC